VSRYWFLSATLPGFLFGAPPPVRTEEFLSLCERNLSGTDLNAVLNLFTFLDGMVAPTGLKSSFLTKFVAWERSFRNELARLRARQADRSEEKYIRATFRSDEAARAASLCFAADDPYQAEILLERERWNAIDRLSALSAFTIDFLLAYRLKLAIAERLERLGVEAGAAGYKQFYNDILDRASRTVETDKLGEKA